MEGEPELQRAAQDLGAKHPGAVAVRIGFDSRTGGPADKIEDGNAGFLISAANDFALTRAVGRAFRAFWSKEAMSAMRVNALAKRFDWLSSADEYMELYAER